MGLRGWIVAVLCLSFAASAAPRKKAKRDEAAELARRHEGDAYKLFTLGKFREAAGAYEKAYQAKALPKFLFNLGQCYMRLEGEANQRQAVQHFETYLRLAPDAPNRQAIQKQIDSLKQQLAPKQVHPKEPNQALRRVPGGSFVMGSDAKGTAVHERPQHGVELDAFEIDTFEVRNSDYQRCVQQKLCNPSRYADDARLNAADQPVVGISWSDAVAYCRFVKMVLPTEAQWEKAARGGDRRLYPWGNDLACDKANYGNGRAQDCGGANPGVPETVDARSNDVSPHGVRNLAGNVSEWVADYYERVYYQVAPKKNPGGPSSGSSRVVRGGNFGDAGRDLRVTARMHFPPDERRDTIGFRCARAARP